ncbi:hypothetical protein DFH09DRAFT_1488851 [Mycena vulgaris]|nr:hypothetical protein DFH09DRAFT_1488851 [Mycena vulgaris]
MNKTHIYRQDCARRAIVRVHRLPPDLWDASEGDGVTGEASYSAARRQRTFSYLRDKDAAAGFGVLIQVRADGLADTSKRETTAIEGRRHKARGVVNVVRACARMWSAGNLDGFRVVWVCCAAVGEVRTQIMDGDGVRTVACGGHVGVDGQARCGFKASGSKAIRHTMQVDDEDSPIFPQGDFGALAPYFRCKVAGGTTERAKYEWDERKERRLVQKENPPSVDLSGVQDMLITDVDAFGRPWRAYKGISTENTRIVP